MKVEVKRIYEDPTDGDGQRILVDRLWPRGISKERAQLDDWWKDITPSSALRKWFNHKPERWEVFRKEYKKELNNKSGKLRVHLQKLDLRKRTTLLYAAKTAKHNHALILKEFIEKTNQHLVN